MARPCKYTAKKLKEKVEEYFDTISHDVWDNIADRRGKPVTAIIYHRPPTVGGLCEYLGITRDTWIEYCDKTIHPEFIDTTTRASEKIRLWKEEQLLIREGKDVKGLIFDLQCNYGMTPRTEIELGSRAAATLTAVTVPLSEREKLLKQIGQEYGGKG